MRVEAQARADVADVAGMEVVAVPQMVRVARASERVDVMASTPRILMEVMVMPLASTMMMRMRSTSLREVVEVSSVEVAAVVLMVALVFL